MTTDLSHGWDAVAGAFMAARSTVGVEVVRRWARQLPKGGTVVDLGCGFGEPVTRTLIDARLEVWGVDASPALVAEYRRRFPDCPVACEAAETSALFGRRFDGAVAIGLIFLLPEADQRRLIARVADALVAGGRLLFSAPQQECAWNDLLTGRPSRSLGEAAYRKGLGAVGLTLEGQSTDAGGNHYFEATKAR
jgi:SAM-dependent methyltransferase